MLFARTEVMSYILQQTVTNKTLEPACVPRTQAPSVLFVNKVRHNTRVSFFTQSLHDQS